ncbi:MAG: MaoC/PaaZ C-terminal domain-containing protein [Anaerolineae bacterium]|nr:MaoC/PaaZ C-terminal domain-containing protein [Anaerolineae bacterium]
MPSIDIDRVLGYKFPPHTFTYTARDACLYALGIGAGADPTDPAELQFVYEGFPGGFNVFPTYSVNFAFGFLPDIASIPGIDFNPMMLLHGEQLVECKQALPPAATVTNHAAITQVYDKGSGAILIVEVTSQDEHGVDLVFNQYSVFIRGLGGFGGQRGPSGKTNLPPDRPPDVTHQETTRPDQALLYRLSGDHNPLHADPAMAAQGGFDRPILHGLCTFGFAARAVLKNFAANDSDRLKSMQARFSSHVFPGETLLTEMWDQGDGRILLRTKVVERDEVVLSNASVQLA